MFICEFQVKGVLIMALVTTILSKLFFLSVLYHCPTQMLAGVNTDYPQTENPPTNNQHSISLKATQDSPKLTLTGPTALPHDSATRFPGNQSLKIR